MNKYLLTAASQATFGLPNPYSIAGMLRMLSTKLLRCLTVPHSLTLACSSLLSNSNYHPQCVTCHAFLCSCASSALFQCELLIYTYIYAYKVQRLLEIMVDRKAWKQRKMISFCGMLNEFNWKKGGIEKAETMWSNFHGDHKCSSWYHLSLVIRFISHFRTN